MLYAVLYAKYYSCSENSESFIKQVRLKQRSEPWMDRYILDLIKRSDRALGLHNFQKSKITDNFKHSLNCEIKFNIRFKKPYDFFLTTKLKTTKIHRQNYGKLLYD